MQLEFRIILNSSSEGDGPMWVAVAGSIASISRAAKKQSAIKQSASNRRCTAQRNQRKISTLHCVGGQQEDTPMRALTLAVAAGALLVASQANAGSFPVNKLAGAETGLVDHVAVRVYVHAGQRYCFYFDGWHGPGWYRCGFAWRRGLGWGGVYGWNSWTYGPWERRHHGGWDGRRIGVESGSRRGERMGVETRTRRMDGGMDSCTT